MKLSRMLQNIWGPFVLPSNPPICVPDFVVATDKHYHFVDASTQTYGHIHTHGYAY